MATDNLLGLICEDLFPALEGKRAELYGELELAIASLAFMLDLNDASALDKLNIVGGELALDTPWQKQFHFFKEEAESIRNSQANIRDCQENSRAKLLNRHFPKVLNVKTFRSWLKQFLAKDTRFTQEVLKDVANSFINNAQLPFLDSDTVEAFFNDNFKGGRSNPRIDVTMLFNKPSPLPVLPLLSMRILQVDDSGPYSQVAEYKAAKARMELWLEARHQRTLQNRRAEEAEEAAQRERERALAQAQAADSPDESELSTDSELDSEDEFVLFANEHGAEPVIDPPANPVPERRRRVPFVFDEWRENLPEQRQNVQVRPDPDNEDECPEPEGELEIPLPNRPVTPEEIAEIRGFDGGEIQPAPEPVQPQRRVIAQIVEDPEFRPVPDDQQAFECSRFFPHERYDELFESGDADKFAEFAEKTREGVRRLLEKDLEHVSHERAFAKIEAVFNEAMAPENIRPILNLTERINKPRRVELPLAEDTPDEVVTRDYERVNLGQPTEGVWRRNGEIFVPHRSDRAVKFTDEDEMSLETLTVIRQDYGSSDFDLSAVPSSSVDLPAVRPLQPQTYGRWKAPRVLADTATARKNRRRQVTRPFFHADKNMKLIGISQESQFVKSKLTRHNK